MLVVDPSEMDFPVLCMARDSSVVVVPDLEALRSCNALAFWGNGYYRNLEVFDASATRYIVVDAEPEGEYSAARRLLARLLNRRLKVNLELRRQGPPSLATAKLRASEWLDRAPEFWEASDDLDAWKRRIAGCTTMRALMELFE